MVQDNDMVQTDSITGGVGGEYCVQMDALKLYDIPLVVFALY